MLFNICRIGGIDAACPIVRSATFEGMADEAGYPTTKLAQVYERLADGGVGVIITGMMAVSPMEPRQHRQIRIDGDDCIAPLAKMVRRVHSRGGKIVAQIVIMGSSIMMPEGEGRMIISPSGVTEKLGKIEQESHALTVEEIRRLVQDAGKAAKRAQEAGFDGVQFHGAHGYLASKFLTPYFNSRSDEYGGDLRNRARFLLECLASIREQTGPDYPVWVKINSSDYMKEGGMTFAESLQVMEWIADEKINAIEVSGGNMSSLPRQGPIRAIRRTKEPMYFANYAAEAAKRLKGRIDVGVVGGFRSAGEIENCLNTTDIAFVSMSRPLLRQPDLPLLWKEGNTEPAACISCSRCFGAEDVDCIFNKKEAETV